MKKTLILSMALLLALSTSILADPGFGRGRGQGDCGAGPGMRAHQAGGGVQYILRMADELELTEQQINQIEDMQVGFQTERIDMRAGVEKARVQMGALMKDDAPERDVNAAIDKLTSLQSDMKKMQYRHHQAVLKVLTPEQQAKMKNLRPTRGQGRLDCTGDGPGRRFDRKGQSCQGTGRGAGRGL